MANTTNSKSMAQPTKSMVLAQLSNSMIKDYKNWESGQGILTAGTINSYGTYLGTSYDKDLNTSGTKLQNYMSLMNSFYEKRDFLYALTMIDEVISRISALPTPLLKGLNDQRSALKRLRIFLNTLWDDVRNRDLDHTSINGNIGLDNIRNSFTKTSLHKIDGTGKLASLLGEDNFIRYAIEQSYFFCPEMVREICGTITHNILNGIPVPVRKTTKQGREDNPEIGIDIEGNPDIEGNLGINGVPGIYVINGKRIPVILDSDGNKQIRQTIKKRTGFTIGEGKESIFQNYIISHIWGHAFDPRYYHNFWNIVIVPAWANSLLDKDNPDPDSLEYKLKMAYKKICHELYQKASTECKEGWTSICNHMGCAVEDLMPQKDMKKGKITDFEINIIYEKNTGAPHYTPYGVSQVGRIMIQKVSVFI